MQMAKQMRENHVKKKANKKSGFPIKTEDQLTRQSSRVMKGHRCASKKTLEVETTYIPMMIRKYHMAACQFYIVYIPSTICLL
jgi:hypothetical protein